MKRREFLKRGVAIVGIVIVGGSVISKANQASGMKIIHKPENVNTGPSVETLTINGSDMYDGEYYMTPGMSDAIIKQVDGTHVLRKYDV